MAAQRDINARARQQGQRQNIEARHAVRSAVPYRAPAKQRQALGKIVAAGAHARTAPQIKHHAARPIAVFLHMQSKNFGGGAAADLPGGAGGDGARIDAEQIASGRQYIDTPA